MMDKRRSSRDEVIKNSSPLTLSPKRPNNVQSRTDSGLSPPPAKLIGKNNSSPASKSNDSGKNKPIPKQTSSPISKTDLTPLQQELKINELRKEVQLLKGLVQERDSHISTLNSNVQKSNHEIRKLKLENSKHKKEVEEITQKYAKKVRGSIGVIESRLEENSILFENQIDKIHEQNELKISSLSLSHAQEIEDLNQILFDKNKEIFTLRGRLEESQSARELTLKEMRELAEKYGKIIDDLEKSLEKMISKYKVLESQKTEAASTVLTNAKIGEMAKEKEKLENEIKVMREKSLEKSSLIQVLEVKVKKLEESVHDVSLQKKEIMEQFKASTALNEQRGMTKALEAQLEKAQNSLESSKEMLLTHKYRNIELENKISSQIEELNHLKVDLRLMTREKKAIETELLVKNNEIAQINKEKEDLENSNEILKEKNKNYENSANILEAKCKNLQENLEQLEKEAEERLSKLNKLEIEHANLLESFTSIEKENFKLNDLCKNNTLIQLELNEAQKLIEKKEQKIQTLKTTVDSLKSACLILEEQIKDFECAFAQKCKEAEQLSQKILIKSEELGGAYFHLKNNELFSKESTIECLQEEIHKLEFEVNETNTNKNYLESCLNDFKNQHDVQCSDNHKIVSSVQDKLIMLEISAKELKEKNENLAKELGLIKEERDNYSNSVKSNGVALESSRENLYALVLEQKELRNKNENLTMTLSEKVNDLEELKIKFEASRDEYVRVEGMRQELELKYNKYLEESQKLIKDQQCELQELKKKKKTFAQKILGDKSNNSSPKIAQNQQNETPKMVNKHDPSSSSIANRILSHVENISSPLKIKSLPKKTPHCIKEDLILLKDANLEFPGLSHHKIFTQKGAERLSINFVKKLSNDLYILGCEQGLYSLHPNQNNEELHKIDGINSAYQMEICTKINHALVLTGKDRKLMLIPLSSLIQSAENSSKYKLTSSLSPGIENCHLFCVDKSYGDSVILVCALQKSLNVYIWNHDLKLFDLKKSYYTPRTVTCIHIGPYSVIYGCERIFEIDLKTFTTEEFLDESDPSLVYIRSSCSESTNYPIEIINIKSTYETKKSKENEMNEYLLCFTDLALFVDSFGRRSREIEIPWANFPKAITLKDKDLFIFYYECLEVQQIDENSYTRVVNDKGEKIDVIPKSNYIPISNSYFLGHGKKPHNSLFIGSFDKSKSSEIYEISTISQ